MIKKKIDNPQFSKKAGVYESHYDKPEVVKSISKSVSFTHATKFLTLIGFRYSRRDETHRELLKIR